MRFFNQDSFIKEHILGRPESLFKADIEQNQLALEKAIQGRSILVIGGAGTIGSSFVKAILPFKPSKLVVVDYSENGLTELTRDLRSSYNEYIPTEYITYPFDFGSTIFEKMFLQADFQVVACFAAHKHVRSEKDALAIEAMIQNNVFNTHKLLELALRRKPEHFFSVSTDKAANPVNVMGASKKLMERLLLAYANEIKISTARFANVAFSNGSLLYGFNLRIQKGQALSSPNDVKRYFVSPEESGQLCMLACFLGKSGNIFFPKLNEKDMKTFSSIAELYLDELGFVPNYSNSEEEARMKSKQYKPGNKHYPVYFFNTDTSGEKSFEEFFTNTDSLDMNSYNALGIVKNSDLPDRNETLEVISDIRKLFQERELGKQEIIKLLSKHLNDFSHIETGKNLDDKM